MAAVDTSEGSQTENSVTQTVRKPARLGNFAKTNTGSLVVSETVFHDFKNPWIFHEFFKADKLAIITWFQNKNLLRKELICCHCNRSCQLCKRERSLDGFTFRCDSGQHEFSVRSDSFFANFRFSFADVVLFVLNLIDGLTLKQNARKVGLNYSHAAPIWAKLVRQVMAERVWCEYFGDSTRRYKFSEFIQCDESKFGRKVKANTGCPRGRCVWLMGLVETTTGRLLLLPVKNRCRQTMNQVFNKHVKKGSTVFTDGWGGYRDLNTEGYEAFVVVHTHNYQQSYINLETGKVVVVTTNMIEGAWAHAKSHFRRMNGSSESRFELHITELIYRNIVASEGKDIFDEVGGDFKKVYSLDGPPKYSFPEVGSYFWTMREGSVENNQTDLSVTSHALPGSVIPSAVQTAQTTSQNFPSYSQFGPVHDFLPVQDLYDEDGDCKFTTQFKTHPNIDTIIRLLEATSTQNLVTCSQKNRKENTVTELPADISDFVSEHLLGTTPKKAELDSSPTFPLFQNRAPSTKYLDSNDKMAANYPTSGEKTHTNWIDMDSEFASLVEKDKVVHEQKEHMKIEEFPDPRPQSVPVYKSTAAVSSSGGDVKSDKGNVFTDKADPKKYYKKPLIFTQSSRINNHPRGISGSWLPVVYRRTVFPKATYGARVTCRESIHKKVNRDSTLVPNLSSKSLLDTTIFESGPSVAIPAEKSATTKKSTFKLWSPADIDRQIKSASISIAADAIGPADFIIHGRPTVTFDKSRLQLKKPSPLSTPSSDVGHPVVCSSTTTTDNMDVSSAVTCEMTSKVHVEEVIPDTQGSDNVNVTINSSVQHVTERNSQNSLSASMYDLNIEERCKALALAGQSTTSGRTECSSETFANHTNNPLCTPSTLAKRDNTIEAKYHSKEDLQCHVSSADISGNILPGTYIAEGNPSEYLTCSGLLADMESEKSHPMGDISPASPTDIFSVPQSTMVKTQPDSTGFKELKSLDSDGGKISEDCSPSLTHSRYSFSFCDPSGQYGKPLSDVQSEHEAKKEKSNSRDTSLDRMYAEFSQENPNDPYDLAKFPSAQPDNAAANYTSIESDFQNYVDSKWTRSFVTTNAHMNTTIFATTANQLQNKVMEMASKITNDISNSYNRAIVIQVISNCSSGATAGSIFDEMKRTFEHTFGTDMTADIIQGRSKNDEDSVPARFKLNYGSHKLKINTDIKEEHPIDVLTISSASATESGSNSSDCAITQIDRADSPRHKPPKIKSDHIPRKRHVNTRTSSENSGESNAKKDRRNSRHSPKHERKASKVEEFQFPGEDGPVVVIEQHSDDDSYHSSRRSRRREHSKDHPYEKQHRKKSHAYANLSDTSGGISDTHSGGEKKTPTNEKSRDRGSSKGHKGGHTQHGHGRDAQSFSALEDIVDSSTTKRPRGRGRGRPRGSRKATSKRSTEEKEPEKIPIADTTHRRKTLSKKPRCAELAGKISTLKELSTDHKYSGASDTNRSTQKRDSTIPHAATSDEYHLPSLSDSHKPMETSDYRSRRSPRDAYPATRSRVSEHNYPTNREDIMHEEGSQYSSYSEQSEQENYDEDDYVTEE